MPDEEFGIAGHMFTIEYDPAGPEAFLSAHKELDEEIVQERAKHSLMDLAGLDTDETKAEAAQARPDDHRAALGRRGRVRRRGARPLQGSRPSRAKKPPSDDDFFKLIEEDVK